MLIEEILDRLKSFDDPNFKFDKKYHKYTYNGEVFQSVTQFIGGFHKKFDTEFWSNRKSIETGKSKDEILEEWKIKNETATNIGNSLHNYIERYFNKEFQYIPEDLDVVDRINKFNILYAKYFSKLTPIVFEQRIFSKKWKIAGTLDSLFLYKGEIFIFDYKTNKDFTDDSHTNGRFENLLYPFDGFYKNHLNEYSIQLSLYKLILEEFGINIKDCFIVYIGPKSQKLIKTLDFSEKLYSYFIDSK